MFDARWQDNNMNSDKEIANLVSAAHTPSRRYTKILDAPSRCAKVIHVPHAM
jgi:hypothetical protein